MHRIVQLKMKKYSLSTQVNYSRQHCHVSGMSASPIAYLGNLDDLPTRVSNDTQLAGCAHVFQLLQAVELQLLHKVVYPQVQVVLGRICSIPCS